MTEPVPGRPTTRGGKRRHGLAGRRATAGAYDRSSRRRDGGRIFAVRSRCCAWWPIWSIAVPGKWFPRAPRRPCVGTEGSCSPTARGRSSVDGLHVAPSDASGLAVVSLKPTIRAADYAAIEWMRSDGCRPCRRVADLAYRRQAGTEQFGAADRVSGRPASRRVPRHPAWIGRITGLALAMRGPMAEPVRIRGVVAKTMGATEMFAIASREWFAFEALERRVDQHGHRRCGPAGLAASRCCSPRPSRSCSGALRRRGLAPAIPRKGTACSRSVVGFVLIAWLVLDTRWTRNLLRQVDVTAARFAGKSYVRQAACTSRMRRCSIRREGQGSDAERPRFAFSWPPIADYFRGRAAYHLYPHNAYFARAPTRFRRLRACAPATGSLVFLRQGIQFDAAARRCAG